MSEQKQADRPKGKSPATGGGNSNSSTSKKTKRPTNQGRKPPSKSTRGGKRTGSQTSSNKSGRKQDSRQQRRNNPNANPNPNYSNGRSSQQKQGAKHSSNGKNPLRAGSTGGRGSSRRTETPKGKQGQNEPQFKTPRGSNTPAEKFAWSAFQNSPDPQALPMPSFASSSTRSSRNKSRSQSTNSAGKRDIEYAAQYLPKSPLHQTSKPDSFGLTPNVEEAQSNADAAKALKSMLGLLGSSTTGNE